MMLMNMKQKKLLGSGICLAVAMILIPPWIATIDLPGTLHHVSFSGYRLIFDPPPVAAGSAAGMTVDYKLLLTQLFFLTAIIAGGCLYLRDSETHPMPATASKE